MKGPVEIVRMPIEAMSFRAVRVQIVALRLWYRYTRCCGSDSRGSENVN
jgi:hypothetical protein